MSESQSTEKEILKSVLEPLLEDFQYWFDRSLSLLESEQIGFLSQEEQMALLDKIKKTQQEVTSAQILFKATEGQVGIDPAVLIPWHQLVSECWSVSIRWRSLKKALEDF